MNNAQIVGTAPGMNPAWTKIDQHETGMKPAPGGMDGMAPGMGTRHEPGMNPAYGGTKASMPPPPFFPERGGEECPARSDLESSGRRSDVKKFRGNRPKLGPLIAEHDGWELYRLPGGENGWTNIKLVASGLVTGRANYRLGWSEHEFRFASVPDRYQLEERRPELFAWLLAHLGTHGAREAP